MYQTHGDVRLASPPRFSSRTSNIVSSSIDSRSLLPARAEVRLLDVGRSSPPVLFRERSRHTPNSVLLAKPRHAALDRWAEVPDIFQDVRVVHPPYVSPFFAEDVSFFLHSVRLRKVASMNCWNLSWLVPVFALILRSSGSLSQVAVEDLQCKALIDRSLVFIDVS